MRDIKFRGKSTDSGEWKYGSLWLNNEQALIIPSPLYDEDEEDQNVVPETVGQFTGKTGKNRVDIYEGDIVKHHNNRPITHEDYWFPVFKVIYDGLGFALVHVGGGKSPDNSMFYFRHYANELEVIGNIHATPELLK